MHPMPVYVLNASLLLTTLIPALNASLCIQYQFMRSMPVHVLNASLLLTTLVHTIKPVYFRM